MRKIQSLNELLVQAHQETAKHKEKLAQKCRENVAMTMELSELVDEEERLLPCVKKELIKIFYELNEGKDQFMNFYMPVLSFSLIELIDEIQKENLGINLSPDKVPDRDVSGGC